MKMKVVVAPPVEHRVWCSQCYIRIAPTEERHTNGAKVYHARCFSKIAPVRVRAKAAK
ncbi:MAG TPA: hypothetical protein VFO86_07115 [Terriglobia bacterium]|nr:hypothetical protein [Terriglobia bacterium]